MTHTLISFLGRGNIDRGKRYQRATYDFGPGCPITTEFFALGLTQALQPDRLLILGTTGSMWDVLLIGLDLGDEQEDKLLALTESADADCATQEQLNELQPLVSKRLGLPVILQLIPYGRDMAEQIDILRKMTGHIENHDRVSLDVTHGLRHLPILTLVSAMYLQTARKVTVDNIYYGALDMARDGSTPVMRLDGLLKISDWVTALHTFDKDGDYGVFTDLLQEQGLPTERAKLLSDAAFFERTTRVGLARGKLNRFEKALDQDALQGIGQLFKSTLLQRIAWHREGRYYQRQRALALFNLEQGDYLRAAVFAFEAFITRQVIRGSGKPESFSDRARAKDDYETGRPRDKSYCLLRDLRNHLAHGDAPVRSEVTQALDSEAKLREKLIQLIDELLPPE